MRDISIEEDMMVKEVTNVFGGSFGVIKWYARKMHPELIQNKKRTSRMVYGKGAV